MSHDSTAAPEAAARKLSGRRRKEIVAVLLFSGGPIFESSIPLSVFGIDRQDAGCAALPLVGVRRMRKARCGPQGAWNSPRHMAWKRSRGRAPSWCLPGGR